MPEPTGVTAFRDVARASVDSNGDVYTVGAFAGAFVIDATTVTPTSPLDGFLMKLSGIDGSHIWTRIPTTGSTFDEFTAVAATTDGVVVAGRYFGANFSMGSTADALPPTTGFINGFVAKVTSATATHVWSRAAVVYHGDTYVRTLATGPAGEVFAGGSFVPGFDCSQGVNFGFAGDGLICTTTPVQFYGEYFVVALQP